jgi:hypothetical protein
MRNQIAVFAVAAVVLTAGAISEAQAGSRGLASYYGYRS